MIICIDICMYIYIYICIYMHMCMYIYIYREREIIQIILLIIVVIGTRRLAKNGRLERNRRCPWNPAPRNHFLARIVKPSGRQCTDALCGETNIAECRPLLGALPLSLMSRICWLTRGQLEPQITSLKNARFTKCY